MSSKSFAFVNVNLIPMDEERVLSDQTVIVQNGRITEISDASDKIVPDKSLQIDAAGHFMLPALADMHIHLAGAGLEYHVSARRSICRC